MTRSTGSDATASSDPAPEERSGEAILAEYRERGIGHRLGFGRRPAILVVDVIRGFTDPSSPLGSDLDEQVKATVELLEVARERRVPILFTTTVYEEDLADAGLFPAKVPSLAVLTRGSELVELDPRLGRRPEEMILEKRYASAFFATHLAATLTAKQIDTLLVTGCTTSGCVRATVVDALQHGFRAIVPASCVGDRAPEPHAANLLDIESKYGDVVRLDEAIGYLRGLSEPGG